jgi:TetR/AcrR family transcriptional regulator, cholesterol catabolism regulator
MGDELTKLLSEVAKLYNKYGIKSITMDDVARHLGISKKTLYQHVSDKNELVEKVMDFAHECQHRLMHDDARKELNAIEELFWVNRKINAFLKEHNPSLEYDLRKYYPSLWQKFQETKRKHMYINILNNIIKGKKEGLYREDMNEEIIAKLYLTRIENITNEGIFTIEEYTSPKFFREVFAYHIRGIANEKGAKFLENNIDKLNIEE